MATKPHIVFSYKHNDPEPERVTFNLYENGELAVDKIGEMEFALLMEGKPDGEYEFYFTAEKYGKESPPSNAVSANFTTPAAPFDLEIRWEDLEVTSVSGSVG